jgi:hypothetical protein
MVSSSDPSSRNSMQLSVLSAHDSCKAASNLESTQQLIDILERSW